MTLLIGYFIYRYLSKGGPDATSYLVLAVWAMVVVALSHLTNRLWVRHVGGGSLLWLLYPGSLVHRLSRAVSALAMGCSITRLKLYVPVRDDVQHTAPAGGVVGSFVVAASPLFAGVLAIGLAASFCGRPIRVTSPMPAFGKVGAANAQGYLESAWDDTKDTWRVVWNETNFRDWHTLLFVYLAVVLTVTIAPRSRELSAVVCGLALTGVALFAADRLGASFLKNAGWVSALRTFWRDLTLAVLTAEAACIVALVATGIARISRRPPRHAA